jgi:hypothetical protein
VEQTSGLIVAGDSGPGNELTQAGLQSRPELANRRFTPLLVQFGSLLQRSIDEGNFSKYRLDPKTLKVVFFKFVLESPKPD